jgi:proteic killer suppression protein
VTIGNIRHKGLSELYETGRSRKINKQFQRRAMELLDILDAATDLKDLSGIKNFHPLKGDRKGQYSMHVSGNWVITFKFEKGDAFDVNFEDYH